MSAKILVSFWKTGSATGLERPVKALWLGLGFMLVVATACGGEDGDEGAISDTTPSSNRSNSTGSGPTWEVTTVTESGGLHVRIAANADRTAMAWYSDSGVNDGPCDELDSDVPPDRIRWPLTYAERGIDGTWTTELVTDAAILGEPPGLDLTLANDGPLVAALTGLPFSRGPLGYCGAHDVGLFSRDGDGTWSAEVAVAESGTAATGEAASDFGSVVGYWPALALDPNGQPAIAYKDVHSGSIMSDDLRRADLELAWRQGGGWRAIPIDFGKGAGNFNSITFDPNDGTPYLAYVNPFEDIDEPALGVWVTRSTDGGDTWERVQLFSVGTPDGPDVVVTAEGTLHVLFYNASRGYPELATLDSPDNFTSLSNGWTLEDIGQSRYDEGYDASIAVSPDSDILAVAYRRCARATAGLGECSAAEDALIFAWRDGPEWVWEVVDEGEEGSCGEDLDLAFDADDRPVIGYSCQVLTEEGDLTTEVRFARRARSLP